MNFDSPLSVCCADDDGAPLIAELEKRLYVSEINIGTLAENGTSAVKQKLWSALKTILNESGGLLRIETDIRDREVQYLTNADGDIFLYVSPGEKTLTAGKVSIPLPTHFDHILYDYLSLREAKTYRAGKRLIVELPPLQPRDQGWWRIGR